MEIEMFFFNSKIVFYPFEMDVCICVFLSKKMFKKSLAMGSSVSTHMWEVCIFSVSFERSQLPPSLPYFGLFQIFLNYTLFIFLPLTIPLNLFWVLSLNQDALRLYIYYLI